MTMTRTSSCTFNEHHLVDEKTSLPSPPNSSCGDEREPEITSLSLISITQHASTENYTIDHSRQEQYTLKLHSNNDVVSSSLKRTLSSSSDEDTNSDIDDAATTRPKRQRCAISDTHHCSQCGKLYKHLKSLDKHQWEHSEYWEASSKLSLTKHQQVQMLEAASILTSMKKNQLISNQQETDSDDDEQEDEISLTW